jgi:hypothetical protein
MRNRHSLAAACCELFRLQGAPVCRPMRGDGFVMDSADRRIFATNAGKFRKNLPQKCPLLIPNKYLQNFIRLRAFGRAF